MRGAMKIESVATTLMFFGITLLGLFTVVSEQASADTVVLTPTGAFSSGDGYHLVTGFCYPPDGSTNNDTELYAMIIGQGATVGSGNGTTRAFAKFNTSVIPTNAVITSVTLGARVRVDSSTVDFGLEVWQSTDWAFDIPTTQNWNISDFQGIMFDTSAIVVGAWYSMAVDTSTINTLGNTSYAFKSSRDGVTPPTIGVNELIYLYDTTVGSNCTLSITYTFPGVRVQYELDSGLWLNSTLIPEVLDWNLTFEVYYLALDTVPNTKNVTLLKGGVNWTLQGVTPLTNYTENSTEIRLEDVYDSICYRVYITVPKSSPYSQLHVSLYNSFTGEGLFWEQLRVFYSEGVAYNTSTGTQLSRPDFLVEPGMDYTIRVVDYFGNPLADYSTSANAAEVFVSIPVPAYSWQIFNMNDQPVLVRILWNHSGAPWSFFVAPGFPIERFLKGGNYSFFVTFYSSQGVAGSTVFYNRTLPMPGLNASFIFVNGTTLSEIISAVNGVQAVQTILVSLLTPGVLWTGLNVPTIPGYIMGGITNADIFNNRFVVSAQTTETHAGFSLNYSDPVPATVSTSTIIADDWRFLGNLSTHLFINQTNTSTLVYTATTLPATVSTNGLALSLWTNRTVSATRELSVRFTEAFTYQYRPDLRQYETNILLHNGGGIQWRNVSLFVPFSNASKVNNESVVVFDLNLTLALAEGTNYAQTATGVYLWWPYFNTSVWKGVMINYTTVNDSEFSKVASIVVLQLGDGSTFTRVWQSDTFFYCDASWTNSWRQTYTGPLYITLKLSVSVDPTTVIVLNGASNVVLNVIVNGNTVIIPDLTIPVGTTVTFVVLFQSKTTGSILDLKYAGIPIFIVAMSVMIAALAMGGVLSIMAGKNVRQRQIGMLFLGVAVLAIGFLVILVIFATVTGA